MANRYIKTEKEIECRTCKKLFYVEPYLLKSGRKKYCSNLCLYKGDSYTKLFEKGHSPVGGGHSMPHTEETKRKLSGENSPRWKGGITPYGYTGRRIARKTVEKIINRKLRIKEVVHHIDENTDNNHPSNLFLFRLGSAHTKWHHYLKRMGWVGILKSNLYLYP